MFIMKPELWLCGKALALIQFRWDNVIAERGLVSSGRGGLQLPKIQEQMRGKGTNEKQMENSGTEILRGTLCGSSSQHGACRKCAGSRGIQRHFTWD
jgi:hypothetical protein